MTPEQTTRRDEEPAGAPGQSNDFEALFVQTARRVTSDNGTVTLHDVAPSTLMFSDRPERIAGHLTTKQFLDGWGEGENSFRENPPNAVLSFVRIGEEDASPRDVVVTLTNPRWEVERLTYQLGERLTYEVDILEGDLPERAGPCSLFIDPVGRPLSAVSVMGVRRRSRRRARRL